MKEESTKKISELIEIVTRTNQFKPCEIESSGLSPDLTDEEIEELLKRLSK